MKKVLNVLIFCSGLIMVSFSVLCFYYDLTPEGLMILGCGGVLFTFALGPTDDEIEEVAAVKLAQMTFKAYNNNAKRYCGDSGILYVYETYIIASDCDESDYDETGYIISYSQIDEINVEGEFIQLAMLDESTYEFECASKLKAKVLNSILTRRLAEIEDELDEDEDEDYDDDDYDDEEDED